METMTDQVFACAERRLIQLRETNNLWNHEITLRDIPNGILETGMFENDNIVGFRLRLKYQPTSRIVTLHLKGAGAYFVDLGVQKAMNEFMAEFKTCLSVSR